MWHDRWFAIGVLLGVYHAYKAVLLFTSSGNVSDASNQGYHEIHVSSHTDFPNMIDASSASQLKQTVALDSFQNHLIRSINSDEFKRVIQHGVHGTYLVVETDGTNISTITRTHSETQILWTTQLDFKFSGGPEIGAQSLPFFMTLGDNTYIVLTKSPVVYDVMQQFDQVKTFPDVIRIYNYALSQHIEKLVLVFIDISTGIINDNLTIAILDKPHNTLTHAQDVFTFAIPYPLTVSSAIYNNDDECVNIETARVMLNIGLENESHIRLCVNVLHADNSQSKFVLHQLNTMCDTIDLPMAHGAPPPFDRTERNAPQWIINGELILYNFHDRMLIAQVPHTRNQNFPQLAVQHTPVVAEGDFRMIGSTSDGTVLWINNSTLFAHEYDWGKNAFVPLWSYDLRTYIPGYPTCTTMFLHVQLNWFVIICFYGKDAGGISTGKHYLRIIDVRRHVSDELCNYGDICGRLLFNIEIGHLSTLTQMIPLFINAQEYWFHMYATTIKPSKTSWYICSIVFTTTPEYKCTFIAYDDINGLSRSAQAFSIAYARFMQRYA